MFKVRFGLFQLNIVEPMLPTNWILVRFSMPTYINDSQLACVCVCVCVDRKLHAATAAAAVDVANWIITWHLCASLPSIHRMSIEWIQWPPPPPPFIHSFTHSLTLCWLSVYVGNEIRHDCLSDWRVTDSTTRNGSWNGSRCSRTTLFGSSMGQGPASSHTHTHSYIAFSFISTRKLHSLHSIQDHRTFTGCGSGLQPHTRFNWFCWVVRLSH